MPTGMAAFRSRRPNPCGTPRRRHVAADNYFLDLFDTALEEGEIIARIGFAIPSRAAYEKFPNPPSRYANAGAMVADFDGAIRFGITGARPCACRAPAFEPALSARLTQRRSTTPNFQPSTSTGTCTPPPSTAPTWRG